MMKSWLWSSGLFLLGYVVGTVVGFALYFVNEVLMWVGLFTLMPAVFAVLFYLYLGKVACPPETSLSEVIRVALYWSALSFLLDALAYIAVVPVIFGTPANWGFFTDQSPWIWLSYLSIFAMGLAGRWLYLRRSTRARVSAEPAHSA